MNRKTVRKLETAQAPGDATREGRRREFTAFKDVRNGPLKIKDSDELLKLAGGRELLLNGDVVITSDVWEKFPFNLEINGNLACSVLKIGGCLKVSGSIKASIVESRMSIEAGSIRVGFIRAGDTVAAKGGIEAVTLGAKFVNADSVSVAQHMDADYMEVRLLKAGSARIDCFIAKEAVIEYDLKGRWAEGVSISVGTINTNVDGVGYKTVTGKTGRLWKDLGEPAGAPNPA